MRTQIANLGKVAITVEKGYWDVSKDYDRLTVVEKEGNFGTYISRKPVPAGTVLTDREYWIPFSSVKEELIIDYNKFIDKYETILNDHTETIADHEERIAEIETIKQTLEECISSSEEDINTARELIEEANRLINEVDINNETINDLKEKLDNVNQPNGLVTLNEDGQIGANYLPSYVDDVVEYQGKDTFPVTGEASKIYIDTQTEKTYRWSGSTYIEISKSIALGETSATAYPGDKGKDLAEKVSTIETVEPITTDELNDILTI